MEELSQEVIDSSLAFVCTNGRLECIELMVSIRVASDDGYVLMQTGTLDRGKEKAAPKVSWPYQYVEHEETPDLALGRLLETLEPISDHIVIKSSKTTEWTADAGSFRRRYIHVTYHASVDLMHEEMSALCVRIPCEKGTISILSSGDSSSHPRSLCTWIDSEEVKSCDHDPPWSSPFKALGSQEEWSWLIVALRIPKHLFESSAHDTPDVILFGVSEKSGLTAVTVSEADESSY
jgi:hypothetical protein